MKMPKHISEPTDQSRLVYLNHQYNQVRKMCTGYENMLLARGAMLTAPCFICGYNGEKYFDPEVHPCAARHHKFYKEE